MAPVGPPPAGLVRENDDWLYSEWQNGGAVAAMSDGSGTQYVGPPTLIDTIKDWFKP